MDNSLLMDIMKVAEKAAIASSKYIGLGDKVAADQAATEAMRDAFNKVAFSGRIVIGEGERDEAPMLYIGEEVGTGGAEIDIAVDPLEGTNLCAFNQPNSICTIAIAPKGSLLFAPDTYMEKIAAGTDCGGKLHINNSPAENIKILAEELGKPVSEINVCILKRGRHEELIQQVRDAGARVKLIGDGDVFASICTAIEGSGIDLYLGSGGSPEGVLACTGLLAIGGFFMGKLNFDLDKNGAEKRARAEKMDGLDIDLDSPLTMDKLVRSQDAAFIACGVTDGDLVDGVYIDEEGSITTSSLLMNASDKTVRFINTTYRA